MSQQINAEDVACNHKNEANDQRPEKEQNQGYGDHQNHPSGSSRERPAAMRATARRAPEGPEPNQAGAMRTKLRRKEVERHPGRIGLSRTV
jgi:hypothetical protein